MSTCASRDLAIDYRKINRTKSKLKDFRKNAHGLKQLNTSRDHLELDKSLGEKNSPRHSFQGRLHQLTKGYWEESDYSLLCQGRKVLETLLLCQKKLPPNTPSSIPKEIFKLQASDSNHPEILLLKLPT
ncbi:hypothetical protein YC2023_121579 [Brassica napus]